MSPSLKGIRAVSFDVGGTLIEPWPSVGHVYAEVAARFGIQGVAPRLLNRQFAAAWRNRRDFDYSRAAWRDLVDQSFAGHCPKPPSQVCFEAIYDHFATAEPWRLSEDVLPALAALKARGLKLAVISNWDERLRPLLRELRLDACFDAVIVSHEAGCTKPAPEIFQRAIVELGFAPDDVLHIGDSRTEDVAGAVAAGLRSVLLDRQRTHNSSTVVGDLRWLASA